MNAPDHTPVEAVVDAIDPQVDTSQDTSLPEGERASGTIRQPAVQDRSQPDWWSLQRRRPGSSRDSDEPEGELAGETRPPRVRTIRRPQMIRLPDRANAADPGPAGTAPANGLPKATPPPARTPLLPDCCCSCPAKSWCQIPCGRQCDGNHPEEKKTRKWPRRKEVAKEPTRDIPETNGNPDPEFIALDVPRARPARNSQALIFFWRDLDVRWRFVIFNGSAAEIGREGGIVSWGTRQLADAAEQTSVGTAVGIGIVACAACHLLIDRRVANWPGYVRWFFRIPLASFALSVLLYAPGAQPLF